jgi:hypothetical protein
MDALHTTYRVAQTYPHEPGLYLEQVETASFQYVIHPTYGRSAYWTLRAGQIGPKDPELYLEQVETHFFQYVIHPTYGSSEHFTPRAAHTDSGTGT